MEIDQNSPLMRMVRQRQDHLKVTGTRKTELRAQVSGQVALILKTLAEVPVEDGARLVGREALATRYDADGAGYYSIALTTHGVAYTDRGMDLCVAAPSYPDPAGMDLLGSAMAIVRVAGVITDPSTWVPLLDDMSLVALEALHHACAWWLSAEDPREKEPGQSGVYPPGRKKGRMQRRLAALAEQGDVDQDAESERPGRARFHQTSILGDNNLRLGLIIVEPQATATLSAPSHEGGFWPGDLLLDASDPTSVELIELQIGDEVIDLGGIRISAIGNFRLMPRVVPAGVPISIKVRNMGLRAQPVGGILGRRPRSFVAYVPKE